MVNSGGVGVHPKIAAQAFGHLMQLPQQPQGLGIAAPLAGGDYLKFSNGRNTLQVSRCITDNIFHPKTTFLVTRPIMGTVQNSYFSDCGIKMMKLKLNLDLPSWFLMRPLTPKYRIDQFTHCGELVQSRATSVVPKSLNLETGVFRISSNCPFLSISR